MGKVISLKLTKQEERIVRRLNKEGVTNSELLRAALWDYFNPSKKTPVKEEKNTNTLDEEIKSKYEQDKQFFYDTLYRLNNEVTFLRKQNTELKEEFSEEITRLRKQMSGDNKSFYPKRSETNSGEKYKFDVRKDIDDLLSNR